VGDLDRVFWSRRFGLMQSEGSIIHTKREVYTDEFFKPS
jgi:hypothetical protein